MRWSVWHCRRLSGRVDPATGVQAKAYKADVSEEGQVKAMFAAFVAHFGTVDILVANAGLQRDCAFSTMTMAQWQTVLGVNLTGQFLRARAKLSRNSYIAAWSPKSAARRARSSA
jgi:NAD(P)-dependent dehydrogenase (short-subunit alcohol dehydrogenase family)